MGSLSTSPTRSGAGFPDFGRMATFFLDHQGMVTAWSAAAEKLLGYGTTETVGRPAAELWPEVFPGLLTEAREGRGVDCARRYSVSNVRWQGRRLEVAFLAFPLASDMPAGRGSMILAVAEPRCDVRRTRRS